MEDSSRLTLGLSSPPPPTYSPTPTFNAIGLYGWRKRCLYSFILLLVVVMLVNLGLTIWILVSLDFNRNGMGNLEITGSGIRLDGPAEFIGPLYAQNISTDQGSPLHLHSEDSINLKIRNGSSVHLSDSSLNISAEQLSILGRSSSPSQPPLLHVSEDSVQVGATQMHVTGALGTLLHGALETSQVQSPANQNLALESLSGEVELTGGEGVHIQGGTRVSEVEVTSHGDLRITSLTGQVLLSGRGVAVQDVPRSSPSDVYEVCVCGTQATLYLVPASSSCDQDNGICTFT